MTTILHAIDWLIGIPMALSVGYVTFFALVSLLGKEAVPPSAGAVLHRYLLIVPAYSEDRVIRRTVETLLRLDYPAVNRTIAVVSDHMQAPTNDWLSQQPILLLQPRFEHSSKARALQYALSAIDEPFDNVIILDADNLVDADFLHRLDPLVAQGHRAIQCHRTAKNSNTSVALLDGASEEINNTLFRLAHNRIGLSSALIGSGMCFDYQWFRENAGRLSTAGEDRELEVLLLQQGIHIHYASDIDVRDEKVSTAHNFQRQRLRWMTAQVQCLQAMLPHLPQAIATHNVNYIDKLLQQTLIPRAMLLLSLTAMSLLTTLLSLIPTFTHLHPLIYVKWWGLLALLLASLLIALPRRLRSRTLLSSLGKLPQLSLSMLRNACHIHPSSNEFIHTTHEK